MVVVELVSAVVRWNRGPLGPLAGHPLRDPRVTVLEGDIVRVLQAEQRAFDAILLEVDNGGPDPKRQLPALYPHRPGNHPEGPAAGPDQAFAQRLRRAGFQVNEYPGPGQGPGRRETSHHLAGGGSGSRPAFPAAGPRRPK